ncbi:MAG: sugar porter family MFS transporter [Phycisphaerae bacterium]|jgi:SP family arabinose:H+ symporter-like MFS transporter
MDKTTQKGSLLYLSVICLITTLGGFLFGFDTAIVSGAIEFVKSQFQLNADMEGWIVSSAVFGCIFGAAFAGPLTDKFGRKPILILAAVFLLISCVWCIFPSSAFWLIVARIIGGLGVGITSMAAPVYISEVSPPALRGRLVSYYQLSITLGILFSFFVNSIILHVAGDNAGVITAEVGGFFHWAFVSQIWRGMFGTETIPAILFLLTLLFIPESPRWLVRQGRGEKALNVLVRINGQAEAQKEFADINEVIKFESGGFGELFEARFRRPLLIGVMLPVFAHLSGIAAVMYFAPKILIEAGLSVGGAFGAAVTVGMINSLFTFLAIWKIDKIGRRPLLLVGIGGTFVSLLIIGLMFNLNITHKFLILVPLLCYIAFFAFSYGPGVWVVISEIFPTRTRGSAVGAGALALWVTAFIISQTLPRLLAGLGAGNTFLLYAAMTAPAFLFVYKLIPETKGKSLEEIEKHWIDRYNGN